MEAGFEVLVVEDEPLLRQQVAQLITLWNYRVRTAPDAEQAVHHLAERLPDVVLTDLMLPGESGVSLLEHVAITYPTIPVMVMTGYASLESAINALKRGAYDYLLKPIAPAELQAALVRATAAVRLQRAAEREIQLRHINAVALTLAHEINNPLGMIMGELQLQLEANTMLDERGMQVCLEAARRIAETVRRLSDLSEIEYERYEGIELLQLNANGGRQ